ncbi:hypothetical protein BDR26DRAFT_692129 [Obelidium mucronatum]|nr:hypothetical protein BDR26DRAFT_692129 [Obelidium mucronatum]
MPANDSESLIQPGTIQQSGLLELEAFKKAETSTSYPPSPEHTNDCRIETFFGFVKDSFDAKLVVEACVQGLLKTIQQIPSGISPKIRSGTTVVIQDQIGNTGWRDGRNWSCSTQERDADGFQLYREVESDTLPSNHRGRPMRRERSPLFSVTHTRPGSRLIVNGMAKRIIHITGSDNCRYKVINYFHVCHVQHYYLVDNSSDSKTRYRGSGPLRTPTELPGYSKIRAVLLLNGERFRKPFPICKREKKKAVEQVTAAIEVLKEIRPVRVLAVNELKAEKSGGHPLVLRFQAEGARYGGTGMQQAISLFQQNPDWAEAPVLLPPLGTSGDS